MDGDAADLTTWDTPENARLYRAFTEQHGSYREWSDRLVELSEIGPGMTVLDLGCGTGATTDAIFRAHRETIRIIALDGSKAQLAEAQAHAPSSTVEYVHSRAENLADAVAKPVERIVSNAAFWQMKPRETLQQLSRVAAKQCRIVFNTIPIYLAREGEEVESVYGPSLGSAVLPREEHGSEVSLPACMLDIARTDFGHVPEREAEEADQARRVRQKRYLKEFESGLAESGFEILREEMYWVRSTPESEYEWFRIPIFRRNVFPQMDAETSGRILERAYEKWRPTALDRMNPMLDVVLERG